MDKEEIILEFKKHHSRYSILKAAKRNEEKPFGYVIDWLKDHGLPKIVGWDIANYLLKFYKIDNDKY